MHTALAALIFLGTLIVIVVRPRQINEAWSAAAGAATMLWLVIVRRRGVQVSAWDFLKIGAVVAPLTLIAAALLLAASFR